MTRNINIRRLRRMLEDLAERSFSKKQLPGFVAVRVSALDELLDIADDYDKLVKDLVEAYHR